jgi:hypothetical protein
MTIEPPLVLVSRSPDVPGLELVINFGVFAGRDATAAELEELGSALRPEVGHVAVVAEQRHELDAETEIAVHQVKVQVADDELPPGEVELGELGGRLESVAERWARGCIAERRVEIPA